MVKKVNTEANEEIREGILLDYLLRVANKPVTRLDMEKAGVPNDRKILRRLGKLGKISKTENFAKNTTKQFRDKYGKLQTQLGTKFYTYEIKRNLEDK